MLWLLLLIQTEETDLEAKLERWPTHERCADGWKRALCRFNEVKRDRKAKVSEVEEAEWLCKCWHKAMTMQAPWTNYVDRFRALNELHRLIGPEAFRKGEMPFP